VAEGNGLTQSLILSVTRRFAIRVLGPVTDEVQVLEATDAGLAELIVVDLERTDGRVWDIITALADGSEVPVLAVTSATGDDDAARALGAGATGVIRGEGGGAKELAASLRRAATGALVLPDIDLPTVVDQLRRRPADAPVHDLTEREVEVLALMAGGTAASDVAEKLGISPLTVQSHVKNVMSKLGVHSKVEAVTFALRSGLAGDRRSA
jgi:DNA-binding NarL/FixJ family response regulator